MIEILQKVSDQVQKVENMHTESMPVMEKEYQTPPVSQTRIDIPVQLNKTPNLPTFSGQEPGVDRSMALPGGGCSSNSHGGGS